MDMEMPEPRVMVKRLPKEVNELKVCDWIDCDELTARCVASAVRYRGWTAVTKKIGPNLIRVWRHS